MTPQDVKQISEASQTREELIANLTAQHAKDHAQRELVDGLFTAAGKFIDFRLRRAYLLLEEQRARSEYIESRCERALKLCGEALDTVQALRDRVAALEHYRDIDTKRLDRLHDDIRNL
jgi:hypothetical protein